MIVIPTVTLSRGHCVVPNSLDDGNDAASPVIMARSWAHVGFERLHVLDLDADRGTGSNAAIAEEMIRDAALDVQACGGVESTAQIEAFLQAGATHVVVGSRGLNEPQWLAMAAEQFPGVLVASSDVHDRRVVTRGWVRNLHVDIFDVLDGLHGLPLAGILVSAAGGGAHRTAIDLALLEDVAEACAFPVLTSGCVSTMEDLRALEHRGVSGAVVGDALYNGVLDAREVLQEFGA